MTPLKLPLASAVKVARAVVLAPLKICTRAPALAPLPEMVGALWLVMPSLLRRPVSSLLPKAFNTRAVVGAVRSTVTRLAAEKSLVLPEASTMRALMDWPTPSLKLVALMVHTPTVVVATSVSLVLPDHSSTLPPTRAPEPVKVSVVALVMASVLETPLSVPVVKLGLVGATTTTGAVMFRLSAGDKALTLPATSVWLVRMA